MHANTSVIEPYLPISSIKLQETLVLDSVVPQPDAAWYQDMGAGHLLRDDQRG